MVNALTSVCKCLNKVYCMCKGFVSPARDDIVSEKDLQEWKRIEGIDQYNKKRH